MIDLNLDFDEGIILETEGVRRSGNRGNANIKNMFLTNKNIICVTSQKTGGVFSKSIDVIDKRPLSEVKVINGQVLVSQKKIDLFEYTLQIQFVGGIEEYAYSQASKKITNQWVNELNKLLGNNPPVKAEQVPKKSTFQEGLSGFASSVGTMAGTVGQSISSAVQQAANQVDISNQNRKAQAEAKRQEQTQEEMAFQQEFSPQAASQTELRTTGKFCMNCGQKLSPNVRFCSGCGTPVGTSAPAASIPPIPTATSANHSTRQQEFAGNILKCPNCGAVISQTTAICPECGHRITGQAAVSSVQAFSDKLMLLESRRKAAGIGQIFNLSVDPVDNQKLSLITSFPVPNTIADIQEFMFLAIANIDVALSKNTWSNRKHKNNSDNPKASIMRAISDAWVAKMQQTYQKAVASFANDPAFTYIRQLYVDKMNELKMKADA